MEIREPQMGLTFDQVWAALMETGGLIRELREDSKKTDLQLEETARFIREDGKKTDLQLEETARFIRELREDSKKTDLQLEKNARQIEETDRQLKETARLIREDDKKTDLQLEETARLIRELREDSKETDRQIKALNKSMGGLNNRFGELAEHLVLPNIIQKFNALGYHFNEISEVRKIYNPETGRIAAEFDGLLENARYIIGVEVKACPTAQDVEEHIRRLEFLRGHKDRLGDRRVIRGALAGAIMKKSVRDAALRAGLYVIEQTGDTVKIEEPEQLRAW